VQRQLLRQRFHGSPAEEIFLAGGEGGGDGGGVEAARAGEGRGAGARAREPPGGGISTQFNRGFNMVLTIQQGFEKGP
jgi:hypothetical protein